MKINTINIGPSKYPILCDLNVLDTLQTEFGSVNEFERALIGLRYVRDKEGKQLYNEDGTPQFEVVEPSIRAIKTALVEMINEGLAYQAYIEGRQWTMIDDLDLIPLVTVPYTDLSETLHNEYRRCFETKKSTPRESKKKATQK